MEDEDVALGIDRDARGLAHIEVGRKLEASGTELKGICGADCCAACCATAAPKRRWRWLSSRKAATKRFIGSSLSIFPWLRFISSGITGAKYSITVGAQAATARCGLRGFLAG